MCVCMYVRACAVRKKAGREHPRERSGFNILLRAKLRLLYAKQAVVTRGDFRELPLLRFIHRIHQEVITVYNKASLANRKV